MSKNVHKLGAASALLLAAAAFAQPASFTDLGSHRTPETFTQEVTLTAPSDIQWFKIGLPVNSPTDGYTDLWTSSGGANPMTDTEFGFYDNTGVRLANDDDGDDGLFSLLSFGQNTPVRPANGTGNTFAGQSGTFADGTYWIGVGRFNVIFNNDTWNIVGTYTGTQTTTTLHVRVQPAGAPISPRGVLTLSPNRGLPGDVVFAECTVTPGANPVSTGLTVRLDASGADAGSAITMYDDGTHGDNVAADNIFSNSFTVGSNALAGPHAITATIRDAQNRSGTASASFSLPSGNDDCAGALLVTIDSSTDFDNSGASTDGTSTCGFNTTKDIWFKVVMPAAGGIVVDTCGTGFDTVLNAFDGCGGTQLACNDDFCGNLNSQITLNNLDAGQTVLIRMASYNDNAGGNGTLHVTSAASTAPTATVAATPNPSNPGDSVQVRVTVAPGNNPLSSGLTVTGNLSALGGSSTATFYDDGTNGDDVAGDNIFSRVVTIPANYSASTYALSFNLVDAQTRTGTATVNGTVLVPPQWNEDDHSDAGDTIATAQVPAGSGSLHDIGGTMDAGDTADIYKIRICDPSTFDINANTALTGTQDTQLFLFDSTGAGVEMDDDDFAGVGGLRSHLNNSFVTTAGIYYIAISHYDNDPTNAGATAIWADTPFAAVRAPDGLDNGGDITLAGWDGTSATTWTYGLSLTGVCFAGCDADFNNDQVVDFFDYLDFVQSFAANSNDADFNHDQVVDFFDYLDFVQAFATGC